jgi:hypothetical protein
MQPTSVPTDEHIAVGTRQKWGERRVGKSIVAAPVYLRDSAGNRVAQNHHKFLKFRRRAESF